jgi:hypothetical protein
VIEVTNTLAVPCTTRGYPTIQLLTANGTPISTTTVGDHATFASGQANAAPKLLKLTPGEHASLSMQTTDIPTGNEMNCPQAASLNVYPSATATSFNVPVNLTVCNFGTVHVSPIYLAS